MARARWVSSPYQTTWRPGWSAMCDPASPIIRADASISSIDSPVSAAAHSGVVGATCSVNRSNPDVKSRTKSWSYSPSRIRMWAHASGSAISVPGLICSQMSARNAAVDRRGSTTIRLAPSVSAVTSSWTWRLCMFSPRWDPINTRQSVFSMSTGSGDFSVCPNVSL
jgi:hypothetical protein